MSDGSSLPNRTEETPVSGNTYPDDDPEGRRWSVIWRDALEELNANTLVSDLAANRSNYSPEDGTLYVPTDGGDWYLGTGSGWDNLGPIGSIGDHVADTTNPHGVTASQADALPTTGGTVTGDTTFTNTTHDSIDTDEASVGNDLSFSPAGRSITSNDTRTINVPADVGTIQEALNQIPLHPRHRYIIDVADGDYPEHLITPEFVSPHYRDGRTQGTFMVLIDGNTTTPSNVTVNSLTVSGACGSGIMVRGLQTTSEITVDDEACGIFAGWSDYVNIVDCEVRNATKGIVSYNAHTHVNAVDFGTGSVGDALWIKKGGWITEQQQSGCTGTVTGWAYYGGVGFILADRENSTLTGDSGLASGRAIVIDCQNKEFLSGPMAFARRVYLNDTFQLPNNLGIMGTTTGDSPAQTIIPCNGNDQVELKANIVPSGNVDVTGSDGIQFRAASGGGFGMRSRVDLSTRTGNYVGEIQCNNGTVNGIGHYEWDGSSWVGIGAEAGQPAITP